MTAYHIDYLDARVTPEHWIRHTISENRFDSITGATYYGYAHVYREGYTWRCNYVIHNAATDKVIVKSFSKPVGRLNDFKIPTLEMAQIETKHFLLERIRKLDMADYKPAIVRSEFKAIVDALGNDVLAYDHTDATERALGNVLHYALQGLQMTTLHNKEFYLSEALDRLNRVETTAMISAQENAA